MRINSRAKGAIAEAFVAELLAEKGYRIIKRNYYTRYGEVDIIAKDSTDLVFIEVKYRKTTKFGAPVEAVTYKKRKRIIQTARIYLLENEIENVCVRFDVAEVYGDFHVNIIKGAFIEE